MENLNKNLEDEIKEGKKVSLEFQVNSLQQLILQRYQSLTIISSIGFAVAGIIISFKNSFIQNQSLAFFSAILFVGIALISLGRHLYLIRTDINIIYKEIENLVHEDWSQPIEEEKLKGDCWPEILYVLLIIGVLLFGLSLV